MKVYFIWDTKNNCTVKSISHRSGLYNNLISVIFAFTNLSYMKRAENRFIIKSAELTNEMEIETE